MQGQVRGEVWPVEPGQYAVLLHIVDEGKLVDLVPCPVLAFYVGEQGPQVAVTLRGLAPVGVTPIWGPEGSVIMGAGAWPSVEAYFKWAKGRVQ